MTVTPFRVFFAAINEPSVKNISHKKKIDIKFPSAGGEGGLIKEKA